jgi:hypothetical protein
MAERLEALRAKRGTAAPVAPAPVVPVPEAPKELPQPVQNRPDILSTFGGGFAPEKLPPGAGITDLSQALIETPLSIAEGVASFATGMPVAMGEVVKGILAGDPKAGLAGAGEELDKFMEGFSYHPQSEVAGYLTQAAAAPFALGHKLLDDSFRSRAWIKSLSPEQKKALSEGRFENPEAVKSQFLIKNPEAGKEDSRAAGFVFDMLMVLHPAIEGSIKDRTALTKAELSQIDKTIDSRFPDLKPEVKDTLLDSIEKLEDAAFEISKPPKVEGLADVPIGPAPKVSKVSRNQAIVDRLLEIAETKEGFSKKAYKNAAEIVADLTKDAAEVDFKGVKKIGKKTQAVIDEVLAKRPKVEEGVSLTTKDRVATEHTVRTEDVGDLNVTVIRYGDGSVMLLDRTGEGKPIEYNAKFAKDKSIEEILNYTYEPLGVKSAKIPEPIEPALVEPKVGEFFESEGRRVKYDGIQEVPGAESIHLITPYEGPAKGGTLAVKSLDPKVIEARIKQAEELFSKVKKPPEVREVIEEVPTVEKPTVPAGLRTFETPEAAEAKFELGTEVPALGLQRGQKRLCRLNCRLRKGPQ